LTDTKICMDCGKQFTPKPSETDAPVKLCEDCNALIKRRFWVSMKIGNARDQTDINRHDTKH
jgi:predicted nucleic acid-binding Zn ribbon protein